MTVSNVMPVAAPAKPSESGRESAATGGEDFASALRRLLEPQSADGGTSGQAPGAGAAAADPAAPAGEQPPQTSLPATAALVEPDIASAGALTTGPREVADQATVEGAPGATDAAAVPASATPVSVETALTGTQAAGTTGAPMTAGSTGAAPTPTPQPTVAQTGMPDGAEAQTPAGLLSSQGTRTTGPMTAAVSATAAIHREADAAQPAPIGTAGVDVRPAANVGSTGQSAPATGAPTPASGSAVTGQVFPHVTNLVSRGDGRHSITLRLHPADLGEVRVTVTVKNGAVDVTMAAGAEARQALRSGSGELRSLLELAGAATGNVVIRDLPGTPAATPSSALPTAAGDPHGTGASADADGRAGADPDGRREPGDRARDGTPQQRVSGRLDRGGTDPTSPTTRDAGTPTSLDLTL